MRRDDATEAQVQAADPGHSTWLSANAGSGKTRVLTDRVARLLLAGTEPQKILCLTYTKAAASEMQNRLFQRLGNWAMLKEATLRAELRDLGVEGAIDAETLARARRLFARAIETPGGLKIQTIHSFCASLLRRFPLEAKVSPDFTELDDRAAILLRQSIVELLASGDDVAAVDALTGLHSGDDLSSVLAEICRNSDGFSGKMTPDAAWALFDLPSDYGEADLLAEVFLGGEAEGMAALVPLLLASGPKDSGIGRALADLNFAPANLATLAGLEDALLFGAKARAGPFTAKIGAFPTKGLAGGAAAHLMPALEALMRRVEAARANRLAYEAAKKTLALHRFATAFLPRYAARKAARGLLDFDDLISRAAALLSDRSVAAWVLYRLDGGIDHILVDEAQDTSPGQWRVIESLAEEFTAGQGARDRDRRIFVVGDKKQSIYSFQGADLEAFDATRDRFATRHQGAGAPFRPLELLHSFRSSAAVLEVVDLTFDERVQQGLGGETKHIAFKSELPGRVDVWAPIAPSEKAEPASWDDPVDVLPDAHETVVLAEKVAREIGRMIATGVQIPVKDGARPVHEGDFLILVRRRSALFQEIIRACKAAGLRIAGADRLRLEAELAVKDLTALLRFLATPEDDLSLAAALRSPLFGWTEAALFDLAHRRGAKEYLWQALRDKADEHAPTLAILNDLRDQADFLRPYELIERALTRHDGRRRLLARLGPEAEDGIDAFLAEALQYEAGEVPSLTGFLVWMETGEVEVKRRLDSASKAIRVMTVHGAKGLESPIVLLPDTAKRRIDQRNVVIRGETGEALWKTRADESPARVAAAVAQRMAKEADERLRLLYVAMTRAENWLIVCAAGEVGTGTDSWFSLIDEAAVKAGAAAFDVTGGAWEFGPGKRFAVGSWPAAVGYKAPGDDAINRALPAWIKAAIPAPGQRVQPLSPSDLGGAKAVAGEAGRNEDEAKRRGTLLHLLLEHLPNTPKDVWPQVGRALLNAFDIADPAETETLLAEACAVLDAVSLGALFQADALREVALSGRPEALGGRLVVGAIDRLIITPDHILAVDFKSNAVVPRDVGEVPEGILRQMGAYGAMLEDIYPDRRIDLAIVWTRTAQLMPLPLNIVREALMRHTLP
jgi:ATP-dependent helicase/nuclease subunit A